MPLKDLSGKSVYDLDREDFETLFCQQCKNYGICDRDDGDRGVCKAVVDSGIFDRHYRIRQDSKTK